MADDAEVGGLPPGPDTNAPRPSDADGETRDLSSAAAEVLFTGDGDASPDVRDTATPMGDDAVAPQKADGGPDVGPDLGPDLSPDAPEGTPDVPSDAPALDCGLAVG